MSGSIVTVSELRRRLASQGHSTWSPPNSQTIGLDPLPTPDTIVTVAVDPDGTLKEAYGDRYFTCVRLPDDSLVAEREPALALPDPFARVAISSAPNEFAGGPVRWLLTRLVRFSRVLLWPDQQYRPPDGSGLIRPNVLAGLPELRARLDRTPLADEPAGALVLDLNQDDDAACFWEVAVLVGGSHENFYVSNEDTSEVYQLHHHDKVVVSIPDQHTRWLLLEELADLSDEFEDWSWYGRSVDDEDDPTGIESDGD